jgi:hypothetical protein
VTTEVISQSLQAGVQATFGQGRVWYIKAATAALTIIAERMGSSASVRKFINVGAGFKFTAERDDGWTYLRITSAVNQVIEIIIGDDDVEVSNAVTVTGSVAVQLTASNAVATPARQTVATGSFVTIPANAARRRISIANPSDNTNAGLIYVQAVGAGAGRGSPLDNGIEKAYETTSALDVRNDSGVAVDFTTFEES